MADKEVRKMTFGKYKGQPILKVIAEHIGYIMWCFENINWFELTEDEQKYYDWQAIAIKKYGCQMTFPVELMYKHVKGQDALKCLQTPIQFINDLPFIPTDVEIAPLLIEAGVTHRPSGKPIIEHSASVEPWWFGLQHTSAKMLNDMTDDEVEEMAACGITLPVHPDCLDN